MKIVGGLGEAAMQLLYPENLYCMGCGDLLEEDGGENWGLCRQCLSRLFSEEQLRKTMKKSCQERGYSHVMACTIYDGLSREMIGKFKNNGQPWLGKNMGRLMAQRFLEEQRAGDVFTPDFVTFVPVHPRKKRMRGYDQAELLARSVAQSLGVPCVDCLQRMRETAAMKNMSEEQRRQNVEGAFGWKEPLRKKDETHWNLRGKKGLLIDDIITTGSTAEACCEVLHQKGAAEIAVLAFAAAIRQ